MNDKLNLYAQYLSTLKTIVSKDLKEISNFILVKNLQLVLNTFGPSLLENSTSGTDIDKFSQIYGTLDWNEGDDISGRPIVRDNCIKFVTKLGLLIDPTVPTGTYLYNGDIQTIDDVIRAFNKDYKKSTQPNETKTKVTEKNDTRNTTTQTPSNSQPLTNNARKDKGKWKQKIISLFGTKQDISKLYLDGKVGDVWTLNPMPNHIISESDVYNSIVRNGFGTTFFVYSFINQIMGTGHISKNTLNTLESLIIDYVNGEAIFDEENSSFRQSNKSRTLFDMKLPSIQEKIKKEDFLAKNPSGEEIWNIFMGMKDIWRDKYGNPALVCASKIAKLAELLKMVDKPSDGTRFILWKKKDDAIFSLSQLCNIVQDMNYNILMSSGTKNDVIKAFRLVLSAIILATASHYSYEYNKEGQKKETWTTSNPSHYNQTYINVYFDWDHLLFLLNFMIRIVS